MPQRYVSPAVGIDDCRVGWVCAITDDGLSVRVITDFDAVWNLARKQDARRVLVDIPIGLSESDRRVCDWAVRERLDSRAAIVFSASARSVLDTDSHEAASVANRERTGTGLSVQVRHPVPKIRKTDAVLCEASRTRGRVSESHPELAFAAFAGDPLPEPKLTSKGRTHRLDVFGTVLGGYDGRNGSGDDNNDDGLETDTINDQGLDTERVYCETLDRTFHRDVVCDDMLDVLVLITAARHPLATLPSDPSTDAAGLKAAIRVPTDGPPP